MHTDYGLIEGNVIYDNWALNIDLDQCSYTTIQKNLVYGTPDESWFRGSSKPSTGIMLSNEGIKDSSGNIYPIGHDRKVINNIVVGSGASLYFWNGDGTGGGLPTSALKNDLIANNTFVTSGRGIKIDPGPHSNSRIINNLIISTGDLVGSMDSTSGITLANNLWSMSPPSSMSSPTDIIGNPLLVDPNHVLKAGEVLPDWYRLRSGSPAIGKGASLAEITIDFWGSSRPSRQPDIGAHEFTQ
jgi:hypothetical protein